MSLNYYGDGLVHDTLSAMRWLEGQRWMTLVRNYDEVTLTSAVICDAVSSVSFTGKGKTILDAIQDVQRKRQSFVYFGVKCEKRASAGWCGLPRAHDGQCNSAVKEVKP